MKKKPLNGVTIVEFGSSLILTLCSDCIGPLLDQLGGWENIELGVVTPLDKANYYRICDVCSQVIAADRRSSDDRREYDYDIHIPERRTKSRRKANDRLIV